MIHSKNEEIMKTLHSVTADVLKSRWMITDISYRDVVKLLKWDEDIIKNIHEIQKKVFMVTPKGNGLVHLLPKRENNTPATSWSRASTPARSSVNVYGI